MGCTIDHLSADHRITVLRDFVDARGVAHRAGESGIIRVMQFDWPTQEIWIDWERDGRIERMTFASAAKSGPRNGAMREFFELGEYLPAPRAERSKAPVPPADAAPVVRQDPSRSTGSIETVRAWIRSFAPARPTPRPRDYPAAETCLDHRDVACDCDPQLARQVLIPWTVPKVSACLACGTVTATVSRGDDGRYTGDAFYANFVVAVPAPVVAWLEHWPRVGVDVAGVPTRWPMQAEWVRYPKWYLPANESFTDATDLAEREAKARAEQSSKPRLAVLREAGVPRNPAPAGVPQGLEGFVDTWEALQLKPDSDLLELIRLAQLRNAASPVAAELLCARGDAFEVLGRALRSEDATWQSAGVAMAFAGGGPAGALADLVMDLLEGLPLEPLPDVPGRVKAWRRFEELLLVLAERRLATPRVLKGLVPLCRRVVRRDLDVARAINIVDRELRASPSSS